MLKRLAIAVAAFAAMGVAAQDYPTRTVTLIVPYAAGGPTDTVARVLAQAMTKPMGQTVVVENLGGASGSIGSGRVAHAAPDGYTILLGIWNTHVAVPKLVKLDYDVVKDFAPIIYMTDAPLLLTVHRSVPVSSFKELLEHIQSAEPDTFEIQISVDAGKRQGFPESTVRVVRENGSQLGLARNRFEDL